MHKTSYALLALCIQLTQAAPRNGDKQKPDGGDQLFAVPANGTVTISPAIIADANTTAPKIDGIGPAVGGAFPGFISAVSPGCSSLYSSPVACGLTPAELAKFTSTVVLNTTFSGDKIAEAFRAAAPVAPVPSFCPSLDKYTGKASDAPGQPGVKYTSAVIYDDSEMASVTGHAIQVDGWHRAANKTLGVQLAYAVCTAVPRNASVLFDCKCTTDDVDTDCEMRT